MENIIEKLKSGEFQSLVGKHEKDDFECKSQPYDLTKTTQQHELAKDISAFANSDGGILVIGLKTKKESNTRLDVIDKIRLIDKKLIHINEMEQCIKNWIFPKIQGIKISTHTQKEDTSNKVLCSIYIPKKNHQKTILSYSPY